jgi:hypothetical protein
MPLTKINCRHHIVIDRRKGCRKSISIILLDHVEELYRDIVFHSRDHHDCVPRQTKEVLIDTTTAKI